LIWRSQQRINFKPTQEGHECAGESFGRDGQHALDLCRIRRRLKRDVTEERMHGGQAQVASSRRDVASLLEIVKEGRDHGCVDVFQRQCRRRLMQALLDELKQQPPSISVRRDGVRAGLPLLHQALVEEGL